MAIGSEELFRVQIERKTLENLYQIKRHSYFKRRRFSFITRRALNGSIVKH
jgi:hypothetical protein